MRVDAMAEQERPNYYAILGVARTAAPEEIKRAYRTLALTYHPDRNPGDQAAAKFRDLSEAYEVLSDPGTRERYDRGDEPGLFGASAAREIARRRVGRIVLDHLHHVPVQSTATGGSSR